MSLSAVPRALDVLMPPLSSQAFYRSRAPRVGVGEDRIGSEVYASPAGRLSATYAPLFVKQDLRAPPPGAGARCADMHPSQPKPGLVRTSPASHRDVALQHGDQKAYGSHARDVILRTAASHSLETQSGPGPHARGCEAVYLHSQAIVHHAASQHLCLVQLFVDVTSAFPTMPRGAVFRDATSRSSLASRLCEADHPGTAVDSLLGLLYDSPFFT